MRTLSLLQRSIEDAFNHNGFQTRAAVLLFALKVTVAATLLADGLIVVSHYSLHVLGLLPYDVVAANAVGVTISTIVAGGLTFSICYLVGLAVHQLWISRSEFERLSRTDMLSGLLNRRAFLEEARKVSDETALILFDIDRFKAINDGYGHDVGDFAIKAVAERIAHCFHGSLAISRMGGEEFAVLVSTEGGVDALKSARQCVDLISKAPLELGRHQLLVTVSAGVAEFKDHQTFAEIYKACDKALYLAKASGRNCAVHSNEIASITNDPIPSSSPGASRQLG